MTQNSTIAHFVGKYIFLHCILQMIIEKTKNDVIDKNKVTSRPFEHVK